MVKDQARSHLCLIRDPTLAPLDKDGTKPPIEPFTTGFASASLEEIGKYLVERYEEKREGERNIFSLSPPHLLVIIDEQTVADSTILLADYSIEFREHTPQESWAFPPPKWQIVRLHVDDLENLGATVWKGFLFFGRESKDFIDANGVWHSPREQEQAKDAASATVP